MLLNILQNLNSLPRTSKQLIILLLDISLIPISLIFAFSLRFGHFLPWGTIWLSWELFPVLIISGIVVSIGLGIPKVKLASFEFKAVLRLGTLAGLLVPIAISVNLHLGLDAPRSVPLIFCVLYFLLSLLMRLMGQWFLGLTHTRKMASSNVIIYGAGAAGQQLAAGLQLSKEVNVVGFVDDNPSLQRLIIAGLPVKKPSKLHSLVEAKKIDQILLAMPSVAKNRQRLLIENLKNLSCEVRVLPSYVEIVGKKEQQDTIRLISPDELLGRDKVDLEVPGVANAYTGKTVLISGAGGSIGSELCAQIILCKPAAIILYEQSEYALYEIERKLTPQAMKAGIQLISVLASVTNKVIISKTLKDYHVQVILHAAAYKHVPLVEVNDLVGLHNNVIGTKVIAEAAREVGVERFILISSDKAVRPCNVMGASKRLAELIIQDLASRSEQTLFSMVRFGNVLGSSGSVIPLFQEQIKNFGPVTLTHPEVRRYFMTIPEATRLVLLAGSFSIGGDVFVLDMGEQILIKDLAQRMIELSGKTVRDTKNPDGDIEIVITGLRPGEKLYEELLIGNNVLKTVHPKILRAQENQLSEHEIANVLNKLQKFIESGASSQARLLLSHWIEGYENKECTESM